MTLKDYKQDPYSDYLRKLAFVESGNNPKAKAKTSSATGAHQFIDGTWQDMSKKYNLGYGLEDRYDPKKSEQVAKLYTQENESYLKPIVGRELNDAERYLGHFLGAGGASNLLKTWLQDPNIPISQVMSPQQMNANRSIAYNKDGSPKTVGDIYNWAGKKMGISPKSNIEDYSEVYITPDFTNLETPIQTPTFAEQEQEVDKDVAEVEQKTNEYNFLEELYKSPQRQEEQQQEQVQQAPQTNLLESFAQISEFVEAPLFQQGGTWQQQQARVKAEKDAKLRELLKDRDVVKRLKEESAQRGTQPTTERTTTQVDATKTVRTNNPDKTSLTARNKTDKEIAEERQTRIDAQTQANAQPFDWSNFRQSLADRSQATGDALRVSNEPNLFDDYLNPFAMIGSMADNLGQAPLRAQQEDSYIPYVTAVGTPLAVGAVAGMGTQSTGQFVNNVANPLAGFKNPFAKKATRVADADNFLPDVPMELNLDVNNPTIDLVRNSPKIKGQRPDYGATDIGNDLTLYNNPSRVSDEASILGKKMAIKSVRDNTSKKSIELKTFIDDAGELKYYMSADMPNRIKAGRAFLELDNHIPIGAKIQEPGSLSFDSLLNVAKQSKNPKFESSISGTVQLNDNAVFNKIKNSGDSNLGKEYYTTVEKAKEGANEVNSLLEKYNLPPAEVKQVIKQDGSPSKVFSIHVPNVVLKKLYSLLGIPTAAAASQAEFKDGGQYTENELAFLEAIKGLPISSRGMYDYPNQKVIVPTSGAITMKGIPHKVIGKSLETGETKTMFPNMEYFFKNTQNVVEYPLKK